MIKLGSSRDVDSFKSSMFPKDEAKGSVVYRIRRVTAAGIGYLGSVVTRQVAKATELVVWPIFYPFEVVSHDTCEDFVQVHGGDCTKFFYESDMLPAIQIGLVSSFDPDRFAAWDEDRNVNGPNAVITDALYVIRREGVPVAFAASEYHSPFVTTEERAGSQTIPAQTRIVGVKKVTPMHYRVQFEGTRDTCLLGTADGHEVGVTLVDLAKFYPLSEVQTGFVKKAWDMVTVGVKAIRKAATGRNQGPLVQGGVKAAVDYALKNPDQPCRFEASAMLDGKRQKAVFVIKRFKDAEGHSRYDIQTAEGKSIANDGKRTVFGRNEAFAALRRIGVVVDQLP